MIHGFLSWHSMPFPGIERMTKIFNNAILGRGHALGRPRRDDKRAHDH